MHLPMLSPGNPKELLPGEPLVTVFSIADDLQAAVDKGLRPEVRLNLQVENLPTAEALWVKLGGVAPERVPLTWECRVPDTWLEYSVDPTTVKKGENRVEITLVEEAGLGAACVCHEVQLRISYGQAR